MSLHRYIRRDDDYTKMENGTLRTLSRSAKLMSDSHKKVIKDFKPRPMSVRPFVPKFIMRSK